MGILGNAYLTQRGILILTPVSRFYRLAIILTGSVCCNIIKIFSTLIVTLFDCEIQKRATTPTRLVWTI
jgi:hypothetical protein